MPTLKTISANIGEKYKQSPFLYSSILIAVILLIFFIVTSGISWVIPMSSPAYMPEMSQNAITADGMTNRNIEAFTPQYQKELSLFKEMSAKEQEDYLNMSKEEKFAAYGARL